jgi:putative phosphoesterase
MRVALISDLHGNALALRAVIADAARAGVDRFVCLGDVATLGPHPAEVLGLLAELGGTCILGNHDDFLLQPELVHRYTNAPVVLDSVEWCRQLITDAERAFLGTFVPSARLMLDEDTSLLLFHGSPRSHMEDLLAETTPEVLDRMLAGHHATVMAGGHTHVQMLRQHRGALLVNPGSVGMPFREYVSGRAPTLLPHAEYAIVQAAAGSVSVELRRVALDRAALRRSVAGSSLPLARELFDQYS